MKKPIFTPEKCEHCNQSTTYLLSVDRGTINILKQIARFIGKKGKNEVIPRKEMLPEYLSSNDISNFIRPRAHGLIARVRGLTGAYCLTRKGADFLHGAKIAKYAIRSKSENKTLGYLDPELHTAQISDYDTEGPYWEGIAYDISEGMTYEPRLSSNSTLF